MERIAELADMIREEVSDARKYALEALRAKDSGDASEARAFAEMGNQELGHSDMLHSMVVSLIERTRGSGVEVPDGMTRVWDYEHARIIEETAAARNLLQMLGS